MGKQSSTKKVQRAARSGGRRKATPRQNSLVWPIVVGVVVVLGVLLIVVSRNQNASAGKGEHPRLLATDPADHWHVAYGINICGDYQPNLPAAVNSGIHTHGDGLIHQEAQSSAETGKRAVLGKFVSDYGNGFKVTDTELRLPGGKTYKNGDKCGSKPGRVALYQWTGPKDTSPDIITSDVAGTRIRNDYLWTIAFVPEGTKLDQPPSEKALQDPNAGEGGTATTQAPVPFTSTTVAGGASTSAPPKSTAPPSSTAPTTAPPTSAP